MVQGLLISNQFEIKEVISIRDVCCGSSSITV